jgi:hypothetical protein
MDFMTTFLFSHKWGTNKIIHTNFDEDVDINGVKILFHVKMHRQMMGV